MRKKGGRSNARVCSIKGLLSVGVELFIFTSISNRPLEVRCCKFFRLIFALLIFFQTLE